jgi:hypothetical protein
LILRTTAPELPADFVADKLDALSCLEIDRKSGLVRLVEQHYSVMEFEKGYAALTNLTVVAIYV